MSALTTEEKIAQLLIIRAYSDRDSIYNDSLTKLISTYNVGGVCFFKGTPYSQTALVNRWQAIAKTPLLFATDAEWGAGMRLDSAFSFPRPMTLGALQNDTLIYRVGSAIAEDCKRLGIRFNFAPVVDINCNPANPVINVRSFGENQYAVARKGTAFMKGLQDHGVIAAAKHFPGHGDTDTDSHLALPVINHSKTRLDTMELYPFRQLILEGLQAVMIAHLYVPTYEKEKNTAATLSPVIVTGLLKEKMGFHGMVITDALDMQGVTKFFKSGEIELKAFLAGNDILLLPQNVGAAVSTLKTAIDSGKISLPDLDERCRKMVEAKYRSGLSLTRPVDTRNLYEDLNRHSSSVLESEIYRSALTLVRTNNDLIPLTFLDHRRIATLSIGDTCLTEFQRTIGKYAPVTHFNISAQFKASKADSIVHLLDPFNLVIIGFHNTSSFVSKQYGLNEQEIRLADTLAGIKKTVLVVFGNPYSLAMLKNPSAYEAIVCSYQDVPVSEAVAAGMLFGASGFQGKLPVTATPDFPTGTGSTTKKTRLGIVNPEEAGIPSSSLEQIDSIAKHGIEAGAYPGCQVLFAREGQVFYDKAFGHPRYEDQDTLTTDAIFDLASLTKALSTTLAIMKLVEDNRIGLDQPVGRYLPEARGTNKEKLTIREIMAHQAGLQPWIPFYESTLLDRRPDPSLYKKEASDDYPVRVAEGLYLRKGYDDTIFSQIIRSSLRPSRDYKYSDLGFYLLGRVVERVCGTSLDRFVAETFYSPLGLTTLGYLPRNRFPVSRIVPTEEDTVFRRQQIRGDVHDPGAAMLGGVAGHAGLFSNAFDIAVILQMLLNDGEYGGKQYFLPSTVREFTRVQYPQNGNRRGLGFDKPLLTPSAEGPACPDAGPNSFGHSGFTGTYFWADPDRQLIYVFLSNRVHPNAGNNRLTTMNIRTELHRCMYDILDQPEKK